VVGPLIGSDIGDDDRHLRSLGPGELGVLLQAGGVAVHEDELRALTGERDGGGAPVPDGLAGRLAGADDDGDAISQAVHVLPSPARQVTWSTSSMEQHA